MNTTNIGSHTDVLSAQPSPIIRLLPELLARIFLCGLNDELAMKEGKLLWKHNTDELPTFPILVASVCTHWREIALNTAPLWSTIRNSYDILRDHWSPTAPLRLWMERSKEADLDLRVVCGKALSYRKSSGSSPVEDEIVSAVVQVLQYCHHRCRRLRVCTLDAQAFIRVCEVLKDAQPIKLLQFELSATHTPLDSVAIPRLLEKLSPHLSKVTRLHIRNIAVGYVDVEELVNALACCSSLVELYLDHLNIEKGSRYDEPMEFLWPWPGAPHVPTPKAPIEKRELPTIRMPHVETLLLVFVPLLWVKELVACLDLPQLRTLHASLFYTPREHAMHCDEGLRDLDLSRVEHFHWSMQSFAFNPPKEHMTPFLERMPCLHSLDVGARGSPADATLLALLWDAKGDGLQTLCPKLDEFRMYVADTTPVDALVAFLASRKASATLSTIHRLGIILPWNSARSAEFDILRDHVDRLSVQELD